MKKPVTITLDIDLLEEIEEKKGLVSRSRFIESLLLYAFREEEEEGINKGYT